MIKIKIDNKQTIELTQERPGEKINIDVLDDEGNVDYYFEIEPTELMTFLNDYQIKHSII